MHNEENRMVIGAFDKHEADKLYDDLKTEGYSDSEISVITNEDSFNENYDKAKKGGIIGGIVGLLAGAGLITLPGVGAVLAAGPIVELLGAAVGGAVTGGAAGGLIGALIDLGVDEDLAEQYQNAIEQGKTIVAVPLNDDHSKNQVRDLFRNHMGSQTRVLETQ